MQWRDLGSRVPWLLAAGIQGSASPIRSPGQPPGVSVVSSHLHLGLLTAEILEGGIS